MSRSVNRAVFTIGERETLRSGLVAAARSDPRITGIAMTGSAARGAEDQWSDVDLAFGVAANVDRALLVEEWTARMYREHHAVHHTDLTRETGLFRVFLLASTLQVDLAFWPESDFGAAAPTFRLLSGSARERLPFPAPSFESLVGMGWLYALRARSSIARGRLWQAEYMISGLRDQTLALACVRHGLPAGQARGIDRLPAAVTASLEGALVGRLEVGELRHALKVACEALLAEAAAVHPELGGRLSAPLALMAGVDIAPRQEGAAT